MSSGAEEGGRQAEAREREKEKRPNGATHAVEFLPRNVPGAKSATRTARLSADVGATERTRDAGERPSLSLPAAKGNNHAAETSTFRLLTLKATISRPTRLFHEPRARRAACHIVCLKKQKVGQFGSERRSLNTGKQREMLRD